MYYYNIKVPNINDIVFIKITNYSKIGTYCELLEYDNIEGFILNTEMDRRVLDPKKQFKYGIIYPVLVLSINDKGIDLSYKKVKKDTREMLLNQFNNLNKLYSILEEFNYLTKLELEESQKLIIWPKLMLESQSYLSDAKELYETYLKTPSDFLAGVMEEHPIKTTEFLNDMKNRLTITKMVIFQNFDFWMFDTNSLDKLKQSLCYSDEVEIRYISSPKYQLIINCNNEQEYDDILKKFVNYMNTVTKEHKCKFLLTDRQIVQNQEYILKPLNIFGENEN